VGLFAEWAGGVDIEVRKGDYYVEDVLYCGKCHTPRQSVIHGYAPFEGVKMPCVCKCDDNKWYKMQQEKVSEHEWKVLQNTRRKAFKTREPRTFANDDGKSPEMMRWAHAYAEQIEAVLGDCQNIIFSGSTGTGKTFAVECIANAWIDAGKRPVILSVPDLIHEGSAHSFDDTWVQRFVKCDLLILDDLGAERSSSYAQELLYLVVDSRYSAHKPFCVTTNLGKQEIWNCTDKTRERIYSRLIENAAFVETTGIDRRKSGIDPKEIKQRLCV
jgi:DNA replication protein DnaC